jgi:hypothetical protein
VDWLVREADLALPAALHSRQFPLDKLA